MAIDHDLRKPDIRLIEGFTGKTHPKLEEKIIPADLLAAFGQYWKGKRKVGFTTGTYDMVHIGHGRYLELARHIAETADRDNGDMGKRGLLVVGLNSDVSVKSYKGPLRPILHEEMRAEMLSFMEAVDAITLYDEDTAENVIRTLKPDYYLCVEDPNAWEKWGGLQGKPEVLAMAEHGGITFCTPRQAPTLSTSDIIKTIEGKAIGGLMRDIRQMLAEHGISLDTELDQIQDASARGLALALRNFFSAEELRLNGNGYGKAATLPTMLGV